MSKLQLKLTKIDPIKSGIIYGCLMALMGLIIALFFMLFGSILNATAGDELGGLGAIIGGGIFSVIFFPIFYFIFGFIGGLIGTYLLNIILSKTGGLIVDFDKPSGTDITMIGKE